MVTIFQKLYDKIKALKLPEWANQLLSKMYYEVLVPVFSRLSQEAINDLKQLIKTAAGMDLTPEKKFKYVKDNFSKKWMNFDTSTLNWLVNLIYKQMKDSGLV